MAQTSLRPSNWAILIALPLTWEAFAADLASDTKDFAKMVVRGVRDPRFVWETTYRANVVEPLHEARVFWEGQGVRVVAHATLSDLAAAAECFSVVALIAHSRLEPLEAQHIIDAERFLEAVRNPQSFLAEQLRDHLQRRAPDVLSGTLDNHRVRIASFLGELIEVTRKYFRGAAPAQVPDIDLDLPLTRFDLEAEFPLAFEHSAAIELFDGLVTMGEFAATIPSTFSGVLDLSICNSALFAELVKRARGFPGLIAKDDFSVRTALAIPRLRLMIKRLARQPGLYVDADHDVREALAQEVFR